MSFTPIKSSQISRLPVSALSQDVFSQQYQRPGQPVIVEGLLNAEDDWTLDYLCQALGNQSFPIRRYGRRRYQQDKRRWTNIGSGADLEPTLFKAYAESLRNGQAREQDMYLAKCPLSHTPLGLSTALKTIRDRIPLKTPVSDFNLWVGPPGHLECLHYDPMDGTLIQLHGAKEIVLFPPEQWTNLYPFAPSVHLRYGRRLRCWFSQVTLQSPDFDAFPELRKALPHRIEVTLNASEALYIPAGWWHEVTTVGTDMACSINRFWLTSPRRAFQSWQWWRTHLGSAYAVLHTIMGIGRLTNDVLSSDRG